MEKLLIEAKELKSNLSQSVVFDCRFDLKDEKAGYRSYLKGHIPGASYACLRNHLSSQPVLGKTGNFPLPDKFFFTRWLQSNGLDENSDIVIYDDNTGAMAASRLWWLLTWSGFTRVRLLNGGWRAWLAVDGDSSNQGFTNQPSTFVPSYQDELLISAEEVYHSLPDQSLILLDARAKSRYLGQSDSGRDKKQGHIPGAKSFFYQGNLDDKGYFLPAELLKSRYLSLVNTTSPICCYCGSGVTACHTIFSMRLAGFSQPKLYLGSWSEWINNKNYPIA